MLYAAGMVLAHYIPPPGADQSLHQVVAVYATHTARLRLGLTLIICAAGFYAPWSGVISVQLKRMAGEFSPLAYTESACGAANMLVIMLPLYIKIAAAFRPDRNPQITQTLNDLGWIPFVGAFVPTVISNLAIAAAILTCDRTRRIRSVAYVSLLSVGSATGFGIILFGELLVAIGLAARSSGRATREPSPVAPGRARDQAALVPASG